MKKAFIILMLALAAVNAGAQQIDTTDIYKDREDTLATAVFIGRQAGNYLSKGKDIRTEVISAAGLCKMACCNLAESFENSASVTVGYSDAVTGARQIRLLGLSGIYTQMLDENRPVMRGLSAPFGLSYIPGQWLESIQIAKGAPSVINGVESMTGQINMEHRKPTDEKPLFINASVMSDTKADLNITSSLQMGEYWSTVLFGHVSGNFKSMDANGDGFLDDPKQLQFNFANRWLYFAPSGMQIRFGIKAVRDSRAGGEEDPENAGQPAYKHENYDFLKPWGSEILNNQLNGFLKVGIPLDEENSKNVALVADWTHQNMDSWFGATNYDASQNSGFANLLFQNEVSESFKYTLGLSGTMDKYNEKFVRKLFTPLPGAVGEYNGTPTLAYGGIFGEATYHNGDVFTAILGLRAEAYNCSDKIKVSPRATLKYAPSESFVFRANGGRGLRRATPMIDNIGVFSTSKSFLGNVTDHILEDSWTYGGNATWYLPFGAGSNSTYLSFDYFHSGFTEQEIVDYEMTRGAIAFYSLSDLKNGKSFTDTYQLDFSVEPIERFTLTLTGRYTNARQSIAAASALSSSMESKLVEKPMTSRYKAVLNLQYATNLNKWIFDFTASANGPCRLYNFMEEEYSPVYPLLYFQLTRRFKGFDIYAGGENLTNFRQKNVILGTKQAGMRYTALNDFDASCIWGPLMGANFYAGIRVTIWKK